MDTCTSSKRSNSRPENERGPARRAKKIQRAQQFRLVRMVAALLEDSLAEEANDHPSPIGSSQASTLVLSPDDDE